MQICPDLQSFISTQMCLKKQSFVDRMLIKGVNKNDHAGKGRVRNVSQKCFSVKSENFLRMTFPAVVAPTEQDTEQVTKQVAPQVTPQVTPQVEALLLVMNRDLSRTEIQEKLRLTDKKNFAEYYLKSALEWDLIEMTVPDKPRSSLQKYRLTLKGETLKKQNTMSK